MRNLTAFLLALPLYIMINYWWEIFLIAGLQFLAGLNFSLFS